MSFHIRNVKDIVVKIANKDSDQHNKSLDFMGNKRCLSCSKLSSPQSLVLIVKNKCMLNKSLGC